MRWYERSKEKSPKCKQQLYLGRALQLIMSAITIYSSLSFITVLEAVKFNVKAMLDPGVNEDPPPGL